MIFFLAERSSSGKKARSLFVWEKFPNCKFMICLIWFSDHVAIESIVAPMQAPKSAFSPFILKPIWRKLKKIHQIWPNCWCSSAARHGLECQTTIIQMCNWPGEKKASNNRQEKWLGAKFSRNYQVWIWHRYFSCLREMRFDNIPAINKRKR